MAEVIPTNTVLARMSLDRLGALQGMVSNAGDGAFTLTFQGLRGRVKGERLTVVVSSGTILPELRRELEEELVYFKCLAEGVSDGVS